MLSNVLPYWLTALSCFAFNGKLFTFLRAWRDCALITNPRDIDGFVKELKKYRFEAITGVNTLFNALLNNENFKEVDFHD